MKITPINYNTYNKAQNFSGLWGKTSRRTDFDQSLGVPKIEDTYYYYPFSDETQAEIQSVIKSNTSADIDEENGIPKYKIKSCKICMTLPLKKVNYKNYSEMTPDNRLTSMIKRAHYCVKDKYVTNEYGPNQTPAINDVVSQKILNVKG